MPLMKNPHDRFFKKIFARRDTAQAFLQHYLPDDIVAVLDIPSLHIIKDSFVDATLQEHFSDLLYQVWLREGRQAYVYVLFEHKSYPDPLTALQLLRYMTRIWDYAAHQHAGLWPILPIVIYHGEASWRAARDFRDLFEIPSAFEAFVPTYEYWLCDLSQYDDEALKGAISLQVALLTLKHVFDPDLTDRLPAMVMLLKDLAEQQTGLEYVETVLRYLSSASEHITGQDIQWALETSNFVEGERIMSTIAQEWIQQGIQEGEQRGLEEGRQEGLQQGLLQGVRQGLLEGIALGLELRFGSEGLRLLPEISRIHDVDILHAIHEGLKTAETLEELRRLYVVV